jgi:hypothetical protein
MEVAQRDRFDAMAVRGRGERGWKEGLQLGGGVNIRETVREVSAGMVLMPWIE